MLQKGRHSATAAHSLAPRRERMCSCGERLADCGQIWLGYLGPENASLPAYAPDFCPSGDGHRADAIAALMALPVVDGPRATPPARKSEHRHPGEKQANCEDH